MKVFIIFIAIALIGCNTGKRPAKSISISLTSPLTISTKTRHVKIYLDKKILFEERIRDDQLPTDMSKRLICFNLDPQSNGLLTLIIDFKHTKINIKNIDAKCINIFANLDEMTIMRLKAAKADSIALANKKTFDSRKFVDSLRAKDTNHNFDTIIFRVDTTRCLCD